MQNDFFNDFFNFKFPQPQYLGAKYKHLSWISKNIPLNNIKTVLDLFSGSQSVAFYFKQMGFKIYTNDFLKFNHQIGLSLIENNNTKLSKDDIEILFSKNSNPNYYNLMEKLFLNVFFNLNECRFLDSFRSNIEKLEVKKQPLALTVINRSITRKVTMGHFAHTKAICYANDPDRIKRNRNLIRPIKDIFLDLLFSYNNCIFNNKQNNKSFNLDAVQLVSELSNDVDLLYLDPPYCGSHADYQSFYHLLETYTEYWKDKEFKNGTRSYFPKKTSGFDLKKDIINSFSLLFKNAANIPYWMISYNDRSYPNKETMIKLIEKYKKVDLIEKVYNNNVGGKGSIKGSNELLFICSPK